MSNLKDTNDWEHHTTDKLQDPIPRHFEFDIKYEPCYHGHTAI
jgi:hypothetical protein